MASNNYIGDTFSRLDQSREARNASMSSWGEYQQREARGRNRERDERYTLINNLRAAAIVPPPPPREIDYVLPIYLFEHDEEGNGEDADPKIIGYCKSLIEVEKFIHKLANLPKFRRLSLRVIDSGMSKAKYGFVDVSKSIYAYTLVATFIKFDELLL